MPFSGGNGRRESGREEKSLLDRKVMKEGGIDGWRKGEMVEGKERLREGEREGRCPIGNMEVKGGIPVWRDR